jgi:hypothetical protein
MRQRHLSGAVTTKGEATVVRIWIESNREENRFEYAFVDDLEAVFNAFRTEPFISAWIDAERNGPFVMRASAIVSIGKAKQS